MPGQETPTRPCGDIAGTIEAVEPSRAWARGCTWTQATLREH